MPMHKRFEPAKWSQIKHLKYHRYYLILGTYFSIYSSTKGAVLFQIPSLWSHQTYVIASRNSQKEETLCKESFISVIVILFHCNSSEIHSLLHSEDFQSTSRRINLDPLPLCEGACAVVNPWVCVCVWGGGGGGGGVMYLKKNWI